MRFACVLALFLACAGPSYSHSVECSGGITDKRASSWISCTRLTEPLLMRLQGADEREVLRVMGVQGRPGNPGWLHFESGYDRRRGAGAGMVDFHFNADGVVDIIEADVDRKDGTPDVQYIWNAHVGGCSDFPDSRKRCD
jgi:hypothetical protein